MEMEEDAALAAVLDSDPTVWLEATPELVSSAKAVSERFFGLAIKYVPKNPLQKLLTQGFDSEQIWQQIEIQDRPLLTAVRRQLKQLERTSGKDVFGIGNLIEESESDEGKLEDDGSEGEDQDGEEEKEKEFEDSGEEENDTDDDEDEATIVDDKFLKLKDMEKFVEDAEAQYQRGDDDDGDDDEMDDDELAGENDSGEPIRYEDFFGKQKKKKQNVVKEKLVDELHEEEDEEDNEEEEENGEESEEQENGINAQVLEKSTFEKQLEKTQKRIEQLEKANMDPKDWTMLGEVTAKKRPKNSALEVDLDFEHNMRPAPVITEEVTASIEDIIRRRIVEGQFDDVERKEKLPDVPPAQKNEIDESKSKKGLGELYEGDYMQSAGLTSAPATESDELKKEANILFKTLCTKLDALAHFHFAPKPVIEDMAIKEDVPALAMEEVAPVFVSDASMLAPEEMFSGKGAIKEEKELNRNERKSRRASKKRKFKAQQKTKEQSKKPRIGGKTENQERSAAAPKKKQTSAFAKSAKVFAELDRKKAEGPAKAKSSSRKTTEENSASFKL